MIIKPYSHIATESFVAADFPCVKHFFKCDEAAGASAIVDAVAGVTITPSAGDSITKSDSYSIKFGNSTAETTSGTWSAPGTKPFVAFIVFKPSGAVSSLILGTVAGGNTVNLKTTSPGIVSGTDGATGTSFTLPTTGNIGGRAIAISAYNSLTGGCKTWQGNTTDTITALTETVTNDGAGTVLNSMAAPATGASGFTLSSVGDIYGIVWMEFATALPADLGAGLAWMIKEFSIGNKHIYPGWKGLT